jgi:hypothetical protein
MCSSEHVCSVRVCAVNGVWEQPQHVLHATLLQEQQQEYPHLTEAGCSHRLLTELTVHTADRHA